MFQKLKHLKDLRSQAKQMQNALKDKTVEATAAHGRVKITMDGNLNVTSVVIEPALLAPDQQATLQNALTEAFNDCLKKAQRVMADYLKTTGQFNIPGLTS